MTPRAAEPKIHIIGGGLAGLAAAVRRTAAGRQVALYEAADQAGGRCRSYFDAKLGCEIDNGNHLLFSANRQALAYLKTIGAADSLIGPAKACFPFLDLRDGRTWSLRPGQRFWPFWLLDRTRRIPGVPLTSYLKIFKLAVAGRDDTVADCLDPADPLWQSFVRPLTVAALNTQPEAASAQLLWRVLQETFLKGETACRPMIARHSLAASLITPACRFLEERGAEIHLNRRLRAFDLAEGRLRGLEFTKERLDLGPGDRVISALPPAVAASLLPEIRAPLESCTIVNAHLRIDGGLPKLPGLDPNLPLLGLIGGTADWLFLRGGIVSLTVSAADDLAARPNDEITTALWADTAKALGLNPQARPPLRIIKEKRATFAQTPEALTRRPSARTAWRNLLLAGDWTDTGYPATIESAIASGHNAASIILKDPSF